MLQLDRSVRMSTPPDGDLTRMALASLSDAVITTDSRSLISYLNPAAEELLGWSLASAVGSPLPLLFDLLREETRETAPNPVELCLRSGKTAHTDDDAVLVHRDGREIAIDGAAAPLIDNELGMIVGAVLNLRDVSGKRKSIKRLSYEAHHDSLTGLENRRSFELATSHFLSKEQAHWPGAFLYLDLDEFKVVNDTGGHLAGDMMLRHLAALMQTCINSDECIARLGGDEFGILLKNCGHERALSVAGRLRDVVRDYRLDWNGKLFSVTTSVGVVPTSGIAADVSSLLVAADDCAYLAKSNGGNQVRMFEVGDSALLQRHDQMEWVGRIQDALRNNQFCLYQQAIIPLQEKSAAHNWSELLVRIKDEQGRVLLPIDFVPAAECFGLIGTIDRWVIRNGLRLLRSNQDIYSLNISGVSLGDESFLGFVVDQLSEMCVNPSQVCFEITETAAVRSFSLATRFISSLKEIGCRFALDDFGMGLSSFAYLRNLPVDYIKIPGRFVKGMTSDPVDHAMVEGIHRMSRSMNIKTIAEHIEDAGMLAAVRKLGIEYGQGNFLQQACEI